MAVIFPTQLSSPWEAEQATSTRAASALSAHTAE